MFKKYTLVMITMFLLISVAGCGSTNQSITNSDAGTSDAQSDASGIISDTSATDSNQMLPLISEKVADMQLDISADGTTQQLKKGQVLAIVLESNASTGYSWFATISNNAVLVQLGEPEYTEPTQSATPIVGAPGTQTFYFQAAEAGSATITLEYMRSWETGVDPEKTMTITVEVQ